MYGIASKIGNQSANGAEYKSQGQARSEASASPLVCESVKRQGLEGRNTYYALSGLRQIVLDLPRGDVPTSRDLPLAFIFRAFGAASHIACLLRCNSHCVPFGAASHCVPLALQFTLRYISLTRGDK